jgi:teichuronic acid biosynthesis glycosyltransferase TuaH
LGCIRSHISGPFELVWFSEIQWDFLSTRKQHLLTRFPEEWRILFIEPFTLGRRQHWLPVKRGRVTVVTVPFLKNVPPGMAQIFDFAPLRWLVALAGRLLAGFWCRALGFASPGRIVGLSNIYWGSAAAEMPCRLRFYDANDDHLEFTASQQWLLRAMRRYVDACDLLFCVSPELREKLRPRANQRCVELGNGVEFEHFARPRPEAPEMLRSLPRPLFGYAGAMDWIDAGLLESLARAWPQASIVLVGPAFGRGWKERQASLLSLPNVHWVGKVAYSELPAWVQRFDLALIPFEKSELIRAAHPNKLYEYAAAGVPVLAIGYCDAVRKASGVVHVADTPEEFARLVPGALGDRRKAERQAFAREHGWERLADSMVAELKLALEERGS